MAHSRSTRWRAAVLVGVHLLVALHIVHWRLTGRTLSPLEPSEAMELGRHGVINAGLLFFAAAILVTAVCGRFFCGWGCHLVALQDLCRALLARVGIRPRPLGSRVLAVVPFAAFAYMFLWPAMARLALGKPPPPLAAALTTSDFWATFPGWAVALVTFAVCGFACVYVLGAKGFCTYACPYGAVFRVADRLAPLRIRVSDACTGCGHCTATCTSNVRVHEEVAHWGMVVDSGCMKCLDCVSVCPQKALSLGWGRPALGARPRRPAAAAGTARRGLAGWEEAVLAVAFAGAFATLRGLYGVFPFLLSLGAAALLAFATLTACRLARRPHLALRGFALKRDGRLLPAGRLFAAGMALLALAWGHSAGVRYHAVRGHWLAVRVAGAAQLPGPAAAAARHLTATAARRHLALADRWGLATHPGLAAEMAGLALVLGDEAGLRQWAARALAAAPGDAGLACDLAAWHAARGEPDRAAALYATALAVEPRRLQAALGLGLAEAARGRYRAAVEAFSLPVVSAAPPGPELLYNRAVAHLALGDREAALADLDAVLRLSPGHREARENRAGLLASLGRWAEAVAAFEEAVAAAPGDGHTRALLARALEGAGQPQRARREIARAAADAPGHPAVTAIAAELARAGPAASHP